MSRYQKLTSDEIETAVAALDGWYVVDNKLHRELKFKNFSEAFGFMTRVAMEAHLMDHHPEWFNVWSKVVIDLSTHESEGITNMDVKLAEKIDGFLP